MATLVLDDGIFTVCLPTAAAFLMRTSMSAMGSVMLIGCHLLSSTDIRFRENLGWENCYQDALRRPGTSPRIVASRSLLRPRPNFAYTPRGRPVRAQRLVWRLGEESRGSFCSLVAAAILSS